MNQVRNIQWLNQNKYRAYPFIENQLFPSWFSNRYFIDIKLVVYEEPLYTNTIFTNGEESYNKAELKLTRIRRVNSNVEITFIFGDLTFDMTIPIVAGYTFFNHSTEYACLNLVLSDDILELANNTEYLDIFMVEPALVHYRIGDRLKSIVGLNIDHSSFCEKTFCETASCLRPNCTLAPRDTLNKNTRRDLTGSLLTANIIYFEEGFSTKLVFNKDLNSITIDCNPGSGGENTSYPCVGFYILVPCGRNIYNINGLKADKRGRMSLVGRNIDIVADTETSLTLSTRVTATGDNCGINKPTV